MNEPSEINIRIQSLGFGDYDVFKVSPYANVEDVKKMACQKNDFPLTTIRLLYKGKSLISSSSIHDYGISENDILYAVPAPRIPPQFLPISFNITIQSSQPQVYHYRPDTRDFDRQINSMRSKVAEIQEACSSALLRISLTQHLLTRNDNPRSVKIPRAVIPIPTLLSNRNIPDQETTNSTTEITAPTPTMNTVDLSLLSDEDKLKRYKHDCRIVQGKLLEAIRAITTNVTSLKQYKVMENHGELGATFTRDGSYPEPPVLTRALLINNVTSGLGELFGAPGSNLVPHTRFHFPDEPNEINSNSNLNENDHTNCEDHNSNTNSINHSENDDNIISPTSDQIFPPVPPPIPSEVTNATIQQARSHISLRPENQIKKNQTNTHEFDDIFDDHPNRRNHQSFPPHFFDDNFSNSNSDNSSSSDDNDNFPNFDNNNFNNNNNDDNPQSSTQNSIFHRGRRGLTPHNHSNFHNFLHSHLHHSKKKHSLKESKGNQDNNKTDNDNSINNNEIGENNNLESINEIFSQKEINQLNNDQRMIQEAFENEEIPSLNSEYYRTRVIDGY